MHGFVVMHDTLGAVLIDTGCGGPEALLRDYRVVNRAIADALAEYDLSPNDVRLVINTHLHFDHCGQNPAFRHARMLVQRSERERVKRQGDDVDAWLEASGIKFELLDGDTELADDLRVVATPGHTLGHQAVIAANGDGVNVFVGDAVFRRSIWEAPDAATLPPLQADDVQQWRRSLEQLRALSPARVRFCHDAS